MSQIPLWWVYFWDQSACPDYEIDSSVMLLSERGKNWRRKAISSFTTTPQSLCGGVRMQSSPVGHYRKVFIVDLKKASQ